MDIPTNTQMTKSFADRVQNELDVYGGDQIKNLWSVLKELNNNQDYNNELIPDKYVRSIKTDSVAVIVFERYVIKIYRTDYFYKSVKKVFHKLMDLEYNYPIIPSCNLRANKRFLSIPVVINDKKKYVVSRRLYEIFPEPKKRRLAIPFDTESLLRILTDICIALTMLHNEGFSHGDCRLNNIGLLNGYFVLFDYNASSKTQDGGQHDNDVLTLIESLTTIETNDRCVKGLVDILDKKVKNYTYGATYAVLDQVAEWTKCYEQFRTTCPPTNDM